MQGEAVSAKSALRRIQLAGYTREQKAFEAGKKEAADVIDTIDKHAAEIKALLTTEAGKKAVDDAVKTAKEWSAVKDQVVALVDQGKPDEARKLASAKANPLVDKFIGECQTVVAAAARLPPGGHRGDRLHVQHDRVDHPGAADPVGASRAPSSCMMVRQTTNALRATANNMREASEQVVAASTQVSTAAQSLSQGATEQAASLEESSASMEEMGSMTRQNAENAQEAARLMTEVDQQVSASQQACSARWSRR